jgi:hypothetical protein
LLQELECSGNTLSADVKLLSLKLVTLPEATLLASLNLYTDTCLTFTEYSSCTNSSDNTHRSRLRLLVHDLSEGDSNEYGCTANTMNSVGDVGFVN